MTLKLVIGNKAYSSWSLRPWLLMRVFDIPFDEIVVPLQTPDTSNVIRNFSPSAKVPVLIDDDIHVWESLAIIDHLAETWPRIWPEDKAARALSRALAAEMHAGFAHLRRTLPMNMRRTPKARKLDADIARDVAADVQRIEAAWADARHRFGASGPFLFGTFSAADAMFAPVVNRLHVYEVEVGATTRAYMEAVAALPAWRDWQAGAEAEGWRIEKFETL